MNRHVIKGRGKNRGKYLCWARMAPGEKATEDGFVWLSEQRKAVRWEDPRYSAHTWATDRARLHDGYFVKLVPPRAITREVVNDLRNFVAERATGARNPLCCWWFNTDFHNSSEAFCRNCAEAVCVEKYLADPKRFEELFGLFNDDQARFDAAIDGGFDIEHDSPPFCARCGAKLRGLLTDNGVDQELEELADHGAPGFDDAEGWARLEDVVSDLSKDDPRWRVIAREVNVAREEGRRRAEQLSELAAAPGMAEARATLMGLLGARAGQKAAEPSFRLWTELLRYRALSFEATGEVAALEKLLFRDARAFLGLLGYSQRGDCFEAPYGTYQWDFVVVLEQHQLWQTPAFLEGRAYRLHPCPSGDPMWPHHRDANPYSDETEAHVAWDCGYVAARAEERLDTDDMKVIAEAAAEWVNG